MVQKSPLLFSFIVPVYNRPQEIAELLKSLNDQTDKGFEIIIVEDGSTEDCKKECEGSPLPVKYYFKENEGRSIARNYGLDRADGDYYIFIDSDVILPPDYVKKLRDSLNKNPLDCFGGPDAAHPSFTPVQKAINFAMTSFLTTGGIRGKKVSMEKFTPRTFNMGFSKEVYNNVGGFREMFSEDIDMSTRIRMGGYNIGLYPDLYVFHKRRVSLKGFWKQVHIFGMSRITLQLLYPGSMKAVHWLPSIFTIGSLSLIGLSFLTPLTLIPLGLYYSLIGITSGLKSKSFKVGLLSIPAATVQLFGYGTGFLRAFFWEILLRHGRDVNDEIKRRKGK